MSRGHDDLVVGLGGKSWIAGAPDGGGTAIVRHALGQARRAVVAQHVDHVALAAGHALGALLVQERRVGDAGDVGGAVVVGAIAIPPLTPGIGIVCTTLPIFARRLRRQARPRLPVRQRIFGVTETMRMSLEPRPAESVHRKRPLVVSSPPPEKFPSRSVGRPAGCSTRPEGWMRVSGPMRPSCLACSANAKPPAPTAMSAAEAARSRPERMPGGWYGASGCDGEGRVNAVARRPPARYPRRFVPRIALLALLAALACATPAGATKPPAAWPPADGPGKLYAHYGEEHATDIDGAVVLPNVVEEVIRYRPALVTMSGDKTDDGTTEKLIPWRDIMAAYDRAGIPYMAGVGNHDGKQPTPEEVTNASAGSTPLRDISFYEEVFAGRPYPMGDAAPYKGLEPSARPPGDPEGAATHFYVDDGTVRWIFIDNSCYGIVNCDSLQNPPDDSGRDQYTFLRDSANEAKQAGRLVFVVMHMPTRDPRDQRNAYSTSVNHVMGKGASPDNQRFEVEAESLGIDAVFVGHIKGQFLYTGNGTSLLHRWRRRRRLYSSGPLGVDHGYWYGFRLIRVAGRSITTDVVPAIAPGGLTFTGRTRCSPASSPCATRAGRASRRASPSAAVVEALELRDPDPVPRSGNGFAIPWTSLAWFAPLLALAALALRPRLLLLPRPLAARWCSASRCSASAASRSHSARNPTTRRWHRFPTRPASSPRPTRSCSPRRPRTPTTPAATGSPRPPTGVSRPGCPGRIKLYVTSGFQTASTDVVVRSRPGVGIVRSVRKRGRRKAVVRLRQQAIGASSAASARAPRAACPPAATSSPSASAAASRR